MACSGCAQRRQKIAAAYRAVRQRFSGVPTPATGKPVKHDAGINLIDVRQKQ
jgi:hypothetical protein